MTYPIAEPPINELAFCIEGMCLLGRICLIVFVRHGSCICFRLVASPLVPSIDDTNHIPGNIWRADIFENTVIAIQ